MPNRVIKESIHTSVKVNKLTDFQFRLWISLITYVDDYGRGDARPAVIKGTCFPLRNNITLKSIDAALQQLAITGCISLYEVDGKPYLYLSNWENHQRIQQRRSKFPSPGDKVSINDDADNVTVTHRDTPLESESNPNPKQYTSSTTSSTIAPSALDVRFAEFWKSYPKKVGKGAAEKSFKRIHPDEELLQAMILAVNKAKASQQWQKDNGQYIPNPATWLNQRRWEDEIKPDEPEQKGAMPRWIR